MQPKHAVQARYYQKHRSRLVRAHKEYYWANRQKIILGHREGRKRIIRLLLKFQGGRCAVCRVRLNEKGCVLDHKHGHCARSTVYVRGCEGCWRGALCQSCNLLIGFAEKRHRLDLLSSKVRHYLKNPPYRRMKEL